LGSTEIPKVLSVIMQSDPRLHGIYEQVRGAR
jgi:hypothetical protein